MPLTPAQLPQLGPGVADLASNRRHVKYTDEATGDALNVWYRPLSLTPRQQHLAIRVNALDEAVKAGRELTDQEAYEANDGIMTLLLAVLLDWDMEYPNPDGSPSGVKIPPTREGLEDVDYLTQGFVVKLITDDMRLKNSTGTVLPRRSSASRARTRGTTSRR